MRTWSLSAVGADRVAARDLIGWRLPTGPIGASGGAVAIGATCGTANDGGEGAGAAAGTAVGGKGATDGGGGGSSRAAFGIGGGASPSFTRSARVGITDGGKTGGATGKFNGKSAWGSCAAADGTAMGGADGSALFTSAGGVGRMTSLAQTANPPRPKSDATRRVLQYRKAILHSGFVLAHAPRTRPRPTRQGH